MHLAVSLDIASAAGKTSLTLAEIAGFVRKLETAGVDMVAISDSWPNGAPSTSPFEATTLVAALATLTEKIGLVASASTLMHQPYNLARRFASLDIISHGRIGWNATLRQNPREAANFSRPEGFSDGDFRRRAREFINIVRKLWISWGRDALLFDKAAGRFHDPDEMHPLNHIGEFFSVRGPLNVARSPQDRPVLIISGPAEVDFDLASGAADVVLIEGQPSEALKVAVGDLKRRAAAIGRKPETVKVLATMILTSESDADGLQALLESTGCDGFNFVLPADAPGLQSFTDRVLPELRRRGIAGQGQQGTTLRAHLGLGAGGEQ